jgi:hypothetical protein
MMGKSLEQVLAEIQKPGRNVRLQMLHTLIGDLKPDALEAHDLLGSLAGVLARRYENPSESLLSLSLAQKALERLDMGQEIDARDELDAIDAYKLRRARREG